jgi:hypothetical protein
MPSDSVAAFRKAVRNAVANYMRSEGCGCCGNREDHDKHREILGRLLRAAKYKDGSGHDFRRYERE